MSKKIPQQYEIGQEMPEEDKSVTIKKSGIHELGLFADQDIKQATTLGMTHLKVGDTIFRTPLGGFINHSNTPNCVKAELRNDYKKWNLIASRHIKKGEELTVRYTFYKI